MHPTLTPPTRSVPTRPADRDPRWLGEVEGLEISQAGAEDKLAQLDQALKPTVTHLGLPTIRQIAGRSNDS
jgi:hypothetical protein